MNRTLFPIFSVALLLAGLGGPAPAAQRSFVASYGLDTNPCTLASPCRGFAAAVAATDAGGEVIVLDSAGYGTVTISKSVSIVAPPGVHAGITATSGPAVVVNPGAGGKVALRGLTINALASSGISIISGDEIRIERCDISNSPGSGIAITGGISIRIDQARLRSNDTGIRLLGGAPAVSVSDSRISGSGSNGIEIHRGSLTLDRVRSENSALNGLRINPDSGVSIRALVRDSRFAGNGRAGVVVVTSFSGQVAHVTIERASLLMNQDGLLAIGNQGTVNVVVRNSVVSENTNLGIRAENAGTRMLASGNTVTRNAEGMGAAEATVISYGNNVVAENTVIDLTGVTTVPLQ